MSDGDQKKRGVEHALYTMLQSDMSVDGQEVIVRKDLFGRTIDGEEIYRYTLTNHHNVQLQVISYGATVTSLIVPDKSGTPADVCLGYDNIEAYENNSPYIGSFVGRVVNRIAKGKFVLDDKTYQLAINNGPNHIHGGLKGFSQAIWDSEIDGGRVKMVYISADGEDNYPGKVTTTVYFELTNDDEVVIDFTANTTKATPINLTCHAYFNLAGEGTDNIEDHFVKISADHYLPLDENVIPTGEVAPVEGTLMDLREPVRLGERITAVNGGIGYDTCYCFQDTGEKKFFARVDHPESGRYLEVYGTQPAVQFYTSYYLADVRGKADKCYGRHSAFCLETQHYPDSVNHEKFPSTILRPDDTYHHTCLYKVGLAL